MKKVAILGSTGSVGKSALQVIRHLKNDLQVVALAAHSNVHELLAQTQEFHPSYVGIGDECKAAPFRQIFPDMPVLTGEKGLCELARLPEIDIILFAMSGIAGLKPVIAAIDARKEIAIANKEILVCAGDLVMQRAKENRVTLLPVDSEHSAIFQCIQGNDRKDVRRLILTASGGPFRGFSEQMLEDVALEQALAHPNWKMGSKITVDSSTLMNKGLELIEASHLFSMPFHQMSVVVHPQSIIHSMVEYCDGSIMAQMSQPDMAFPIQYALTYPHRKPGAFPSFDFTKHSSLTFEEADRKKFPCLAMAETALRLGRSYPCFLNAANEVLVHRFMNREIRWVEISQKLEKLMSSHQSFDVLNLEAVLFVDGEARKKAGKI